MKITAENYEVLKKECIQKYAEANILAEDLDRYYKTTDEHKIALRKIVHNWIDIDEDGNTQINEDRYPSYNIPANIGWGK